MSGGRVQTGAQLGGDGVPAQRQLQALGHRAQAGGEHRCWDSERVAHITRDPMVASACGFSGGCHRISLPSIEEVCFGSHRWWRIQRPWARSLRAGAPQKPFSHLKPRFFGGARGEIATPESCGTYTTTGLLTPWSAPESGPGASVSDSFPINTGCVSGFAPSFTAGTTSPQAASYAPFVLSLSRQDNEQEISSLAVSLPPGLIAKLAGVGRCSEGALQAAKENPSGAAEIVSPSCPAASEVGSVEASSGVGSDPLFLPGKAYLTGPYKNAPLGLAVIVPAVAGPFDFGNVVVRTALYIDPSDAHVTAISDPFPTIVDAKGADGQIDGIQPRLRSVLVKIDRPEFTLNPSSCDTKQILGTLTSTQGVQSNVSSRFQVGGCRELKFAPKFSVKTSGHTSKADGASLFTRVAYPQGPAGTYANIARVKVDLPKALPSRLTTLQKACTSAQFDSNPAGCPSASVVGYAKATTPILNVPLAGPAYFVSHGNEAFPQLILLLQGEGISIDLVGDTLIKHGITSSTFKAVPDAPVSNFELNLPQGAFSALSANGNLCTQKLVMPTEFVAQNGATLSQNTHIEVEGCEFVVKVKSVY